MSPHSSDALVHDGEYQDDYIELNGVRLLVEGPIQINKISEFAAGLKIGKATYDQRE